jgi:uncharacterized protein involved in outer membrane biogenesis
MRLKWIVGTGFFLIIVLMASVYVFLLTYDYNKLKPRIVRMVKETTGRELNLGGPINLDIGLSPALVVTDVTFANASWGSKPQMARIDELQARIRLLPLLVREVELKHIGLKGVDVLFETNPDGVGNWEFPGNEGAVKHPEASGAIRIDADNIRIENLDLTFRDGITGFTARFGLADLKMARPAAGSGLVVDLRADYNGQPVTLSGKTGWVSELLGSERFPFKLSGTFADAAVRLEGAVDDVLSLKGIDLEARVAGSNLAEIKLINSIQLPKTDTFDLAGRLRGSKSALGLNDLRGNLSANGAHLAVSGSIGNLTAVDGVDLRVKSSGKDLSAVGAIVGQKLPATDKFAVDGRLTGSARVLSLSEVSGNASRGSLDLTLNGKVKDLTAFSGLDLQVKGAGKNLAEMGVLIDRKLPVTDEFEMEGRLTGSIQALSLQATQGSARRGSLNVALSGEVKDLIAFSGVDLRVKGSGKNVSAVGAIIGQKLPVTDKFAVGGRLTGSAKALSLSEASGSASRDSLHLTLNGKVKDLMAFSGMDLLVKGSGRDLAEVGALIGQKLPVTDEFTVGGRLTGSAESLSLQQAEGSVSRGSLNLTLSGGIDALRALEGLNFTLKATGKELAEIGPLVGVELPDLGPFDMSAELSGSTKAILLKAFSAVVDRSDFNGRAEVEFFKRPKITVRLISSVIDFTALMQSLEKDSQKYAEEKRKKGRLFSKAPLPFDVLNTIDADIVLKARNIQARDARLEFGHLSLKLDNGDFTIDTLEATYKQTKISGSLDIHATAPPQVTTKFLVQSFNLGDFLKETGKSDQVRAIVDIAAHGKSSGNSVHSLMANLNGAFGAVMGPGYLNEYLDLLSMDLAQKVIPIWGRNKKANEINCAVVQFDIKDGVATSQAFVFDTQIGILSAEGDMNLRTEKVNFLLNPRPKDFSLVSLSTKLRVTGRFMDPKVRPDTLSIAKKGATLLGGLAFGPLGLLAPFIKLGAHQKHPCAVKSLEELGLSIPAKK